MKKCISLLMAVAMILALAIPAFADNPPGQSTVTVKGDISVPTIEIEAPSEATLVLNPYRMKYNGDIKLLKDSQDQILALPGVYVNKSDVDLRIAVTAELTLGTNVVLVAATPAATGAAKQVELKFEFGEMADKDGSAFVSTNTTNYSATDFPVATKKIELKKDGSTDSRLKIDATDGKTANYFGFKFSGSATADPDTAWAAADTIGVSVVVTPTPIALTVASGS